MMIVVTIDGFRSGRMILVNIEYLLHIRKPEETSEEKLALTEHEAESALQTIIEEKTGLSYTPEWDAVIKGIVDNSHTL